MLVCLLIKITKLFLGVHLTILISGKSISQYTSYSIIFSPLQTENSMKSISTVNAAITENMEC